MPPRPPRPKWPLGFQGSWQRLRRAGALSMIAASLICAASFAGCAYHASPKRLDLSQRNQALRNRLATLRHTLAIQRKKIAMLKRQLARKTPRIATLPTTRLRDLFTVQRVAILSSTHASAFDASGPKKGFRVFVRAYGPGGMILPAPGRCAIQAFDLASKHGPRLLGRWNFSARQCKRDWYGMLGLDQFAFNCPWKAPPVHRGITFRLVFQDALTGRRLLAQRVVVLRHFKRPAKLNKPRRRPPITPRKMK